MPPESIDSPYRQVLLDALQYQGAAYDCGPYTVATVLRALLDAQVDGAQISEEMNRLHWRGPLPVVRRIPNWATFPWGMADVFHNYGLKSSWPLFTKLERLRGRLASPTVLMPILASWRERTAHVMALVAWDAQLGWGFANTAYQHHNVHWVDDHTFQRQWRASLHWLVEARLA